MGKQYTKDEWYNIPQSILSKVHMKTKLHTQHGHPINIISTRIRDSIQFLNKDGFKYNYPHYVDLPPTVNVVQNFDSLLIGSDHVSRGKSDTYYINSSNLLRTHTSAHQSDLIRRIYQMQTKKSSIEEQNDINGFLVTADVYRRDEIDSVHYPVFHQMEGVRIFKSVDEVEAELRNLYQDQQLVPLKFDSDNPIQSAHMQDRHFLNLVTNHLKLTIQNSIKKIFKSDNLKMRWVDAYFPFTSPSYELEIFWNGKWIEVCGCGIIQDKIIQNASDKQAKDQIGWAFGIGLERIAMTLFDIPDIRLFWTEDERFIQQFKDAYEENIKFKSYSKHPAVYKDVSFWEPEQFHENDFCELVREVAGDLVEEVKLIDQFTHPKTKRSSRCYRINYRSMEKNLLNSEIDILQDRVLQELKSKLKLEYR